MVIPATLLVLLLTVQGERLFLADAFSSPRVVNRDHLHRPSCNVFQIPPSTQNSRLVASLSVTSGDFAAGGTLMLSSIIGMISEKFNFSGGHVVTLLSAALLSNTSRSVPTDHMLYNLCWSIFLPSSLVFALLSTSSTNKIDEQRDPSSSSSSSVKHLSNKATKMNSSILGMAVPFTAGSIGSIIGCCASFFLIKFNDVKATAILAGCLCASYIGGTVNFFAAAKILIPMFNCNNTGEGGISSLFGSLAAADLVVMAMYFSLLSFASKSTVLQSLFPSRGDVDASVKIPNNVAELNGDSSSKKSETNASVGSSITAVILACIISISSVLAATDLEKKINNVANIPGSMCAFLAVFGLIAERLVGMGLNQMKSTSFAKESYLVRSLEKVAVVSPNLSNICFYLLFASVGTTADIASAIGSGPKALTFASLALVIHCAVALVGAFVGGRLVRGKLPQSTLQEVLTASNAAIGGPSTAAAFAADLVPTTLSQLRRSLILGATVWGVFGYAIGTATGVMLAKALMRLV